MFRAAFPDATEDDERSDAAWIKQVYDIAGANGGSKDSTRNHLRLAGTWLPVDIAMNVAESYEIDHMVRPLTVAEPDSSQQPRKSNNTNGTQEVQEIKPPSVAQPTTAPAKALSPPAKRRKAASPAAQTTTNAPLSPPAPTRKLRSSKSPAPAKPVSTAKARSSKRLATKTVTPPIEISEDESAPEVAAVDPEVDIQESKQLVEELKATYSKSSVTSSAAKRPVDDDKLTFEPKEPEIGERVIAGPSRLRNLQPQGQAAAWGALAFAVGLGAT